ncbi:MAG: AraC family transcriptional regulator [Saprospiraceae bacterium]|nr:AraC family transcriptional regulator [Saprospiraceae bacterium]
MTQETKWKMRLEELITKNLNSKHLSNEFLAREMGLSERHLIRKAKMITGKSPQKITRNLRLKIAMKHIRSGQFRTVREVGQAVGYTNIGYFIKEFKKEFECKPFEVLQAAGWR